jgi:subtilisin family serine protease
VIGVSGIKQNMTFALNDNAPCSNADDPLPGSSWGLHVDFAAPWDAHSTIANNEYAGVEAQWCGTSMAAPHVAGLAALVRSYYPGANRSYVYDRLKSTALDLGAYGSDQYYGWGMPRYLAVGFNAPVITATIVSGRPRLTWPAVPHATSYQIWRWVTPTAPTAVLWATVTGTTYTDYPTKVTSFYGYNMFPNPSTVSVSYQVTAVAANLTWAGAYATYIPNGIPPT